MRKLLLSLGMMVAAGTCTAGEHAASGAPAARRAAAPAKPAKRYCGESLGKVTIYHKGHSWLERKQYKLDLIFSPDSRNFTVEYNSLRDGGLSWQYDADLGFFGERPYGRKGLRHQGFFTADGQIAANYWTGSADKLLEQVRARLGDYYSGAERDRLTKAITCAEIVLQGVRHYSGPPAQHSSGFGSDDVPNPANPYDPRSRILYRSMYQSAYGSHFP